MDSIYTIVPEATFTSSDIDKTYTFPTQILNGTTVRLDFSLLKFPPGNIKRNKVKIKWGEDGPETTINASLATGSLDPLNTAGPFHLVTKNIDAIETSTLVKVTVEFYNIAGEVYTLFIEINVATRSLISMELNVTPSFSIYTGDLSATILDIRPEELTTGFPDYKTPVLVVLT